MVVKRVVGIGVNVNLDIIITFEMAADFCDRRLRHMLIEPAEMHLQRAGDVSRLAQMPFDADAVERHRDIDILARGGEIGELAAETKADATGLAGARDHGTQRS